MEPRGRNNASLRTNLRLPSSSNKVKTFPTGLKPRGASQRTEEVKRASSPLFGEKRRKGAVERRARMACYNGDTACNSIRQRLKGNTLEVINASTSGRPALVGGSAIFIFHSREPAEVILIRDIRDFAVEQLRP